MPRHSRLAVVLALLLTLSWGCGPAAARQDAPEVRLGLVATFSGEGFRAGRDALEAARFAVEAATAAGIPAIDGTPCRVTLIPFDDKDSPQQAAKGVRELAAHKHVTAIIGPYPSGLANAAALAADAAGVPLVAPSATAAVVTAGRPHIFRIPFTDAFQGLVLGRLTRRELDLARVAVIANRDSLSSASLADAFVKAFSACGGKADLYTYADRDRDFGKLMDKALADAPQALFLPNATKETILLALAARKAGFTGTLIGGDAWDGREVSGLDAFKGAYFVDHWRENAPGERSHAYVAAFKKARKRSPTEIGALTQDAVDVVLAAVARAGSTDRAAVTRALMDLPPHDGVTGTFDFIDDGNPVKSLYITKVTDGGTHLESAVLPPPEPCGK